MGYRNDRDGALTYVGARYYDAQVDPFITRDTYLDQKPYLYCEHDPVNSLDPSGHGPVADLGGGVATIGAGYAAGSAAGTTITISIGAVEPIEILLPGGLVAPAIVVIIEGTAAACDGGYHIGEWITQTPTGQKLTNWLGGLIARYAPWLE
jgi:RHS repeat-associated protein